MLSLLLFALSAGPRVYVADAPPHSELATLAALGEGGRRTALSSFPVRRGDLPRGALSPEGGRAAWVILGPGGKGLMDARLEVVELERGRARPLAQGVLDFETPRWSPDGARIAYLAVTRVHPPAAPDAEGAPIAREDYELWTAAADGTGRARWLGATTYGLSLAAYARAGVVLYEDDGAGGYRLLLATQGDTRELTRLPGPARAFQLVRGGSALLCAARSAGTRQWAILETSLETGRTSSLLEGEGDRLEPFALGELLFVGVAGAGGVAGALERRDLQTGAIAAPPLPEGVAVAGAPGFAVIRGAEGLALFDAARGVEEPLATQAVASVLGVAP
ncbi:MAG: TolB-like translocation protein [Deltaproteobacteria bacterium]